MRAKKVYEYFESNNLGSPDPNEGMEESYLRNKYFNPHGDWDQSGVWGYYDSSDSRIVKNIIIPKLEESKLDYIYSDFLNFISIECDSVEEAIIASNILKEVGFDKWMSDKLKIHQENNKLIDKNTGIISRKHKSW